MFVLKLSQNRLFPFGKCYFLPLPLCVVLLSPTSPGWCCGSSSWFSVVVLSPLSPFGCHNSSTIDVFSLSIMTRDFHAKHISWPKHGLVLLLAEKKKPLSVSFSTRLSPIPLPSIQPGAVPYFWSTFQSTALGFTNTMTDTALSTPPPSMVVPRFPSGSSVRK